jgi:hypothetical protein
MISAKIHNNAHVTNHPVITALFLSNRKQGGDFFVFIYTKTFWY